MEIKNYTIDFSDFSVGTLSSFARKNWFFVIEDGKVVRYGFED